MTESGMLCPKCNGGTTIYNTRNRPNGRTWRRRECLHCGYRFTTTEYVAEKFKGKKEGYL